MNGEVEAARTVGGGESIAGEFTVSAQACMHAQARRRREVVCIVSATLEDVLRTGFPSVWFPEGCL